MNGNYSDNSYGMRPSTPTHPPGDAEVPEIPKHTVDREMMDELDLNPDLDDSTPRLTSDSENARDSPAIADSEWEDVDDDNLQHSLSYQTLIREFQNPSHKRLNSAQQSKFINYIDEELLSLQRRFIKSHVEHESLSFLELLEALTTIIKLINITINCNSRLFGQQEYYIKILGDFEEYLKRFNVLSGEEFHELFEFFHDMDLKVTFLIDGYKVQDGISKMEKLQVTERVRLNGIVIRLRMLMLEILEKSRIGGFEIELGSLFDNILDRTSRQQ